MKSWTEQTFGILINCTNLLCDDLVNYARVTYVHSVERSVLRDFELLEENALLDVVNADVFRLTTGEYAIPIGRVRQGRERPGIARLKGVKSDFCKVAVEFSIRENN